MASSSVTSTSIMSSMFHSPKRPSQGTRRKELMSKCSYGGGADFSSILSYSLSVSATRNLNSSKLAFEPCEGYYNSNLLSESLAFFGEKDFSFFGYKYVSNTRRQRQKDPTAHSGNCSILSVLFLLYLSRWLLCSLN